MTSPGTNFWLRFSRRWGDTGLFLTAAAVFSADQMSKSLVNQRLAGPDPPVEVLGSWLRLTYVTNTGAAFGLFPDRTILLAVIAFVAVPLLLVFQRYLGISGWLAKVSVGLLLGSTVGNLVDRLRFGYVVDFIDAGVGNLRWPTFNVADSAFVIGLLLLCLLLFLPSESSRPNATSR